MKKLQEKENFSPSSYSPPDKSVQLRRLVLSLNHGIPCSTLGNVEGR